MFKLQETKGPLPLSDTEIKSSQKTWLGARHYQYFLLSFTLTLFFGMRTALSVGIIAMVNKNPPSSNIPTYPEWTDTDTILSSFFWGYILTQIPAGQLSEYYGPKWFLAGSMFLGSVFNILIPIMGSCWGSMGVIFCRVVQGLAQGFLYPCISNIMSEWTPVFERSRVSAFIYGGASVGIITSMPFTGAVADSIWGWPVACYIYGSLGIAWTCVFALFAADSPQLHPWISDEEKTYIESNTCLGNTSNENMSTPWKSIFASKSVWAVFIASSGASWGGFTLLTEIPTYMNNVMNFNIAENSRLSALPYLALLLSGLIGAPIADKLITSNLVRIGTTRKIFTALGSLFPAGALIYLGFLRNNQRNLATGLLVVAVGTSAFTQCGYLVNPIDLSPKYAGTITGIVNCFSTFFSLLGPLSVQFLGDDKINPELWWKVFRLAAIFYIASGIIYIIFASGETQVWNDEKSQEKSQKKIHVTEEKSDIYVICK